MLVFQVENMTCGHCAAAITQAVHGVDVTARVEVDLAKRRVAVDAPAADVEALRTAITQAGYHAVQVAEPSLAVASARTVGCGCGSGGARCGT